MNVSDLTVNGAEVQLKETLLVRVNPCPRIPTVHSNFGESIYKTDERTHARIKAKERARPRRSPLLGAPVETSRPVA